MPRLIWVFAGRTVTLLVLSCRGSYGNCDSFSVWTTFTFCQILRLFWSVLKYILSNQCLSMWGGYRANFFRYKWFTKCEFYVMNNLFLNFTWSVQRCVAWSPAHDFYVVWYFVYICRLHVILFCLYLRMFYNIDLNITTFQYLCWVPIMFHTVNGIEVIFSKVFLKIWNFHSVAVRSTTKPTIWPVRPSAWSYKGFFMRTATTADMSLC